MNVSKLQEQIEVIYLKSANLILNGITKENGMNLQTQKKEQLKTGMLIFLKKLSLFIIIKLNGKD